MKKSGTDHNRPLLALALIEGGAVMAAELVAARMLAPVYGGSLQVWGAIIGVTLVSLTAGYWWGGRLSLSPTRRRILLVNILLAGVAIAAMPLYAAPLAISAHALPTLPAIVLAAGVMLLPPLLLLGTVPPLIVSLLSDSRNDAGRAAGQVYGISTVGGIAATFLTGFWLIPELGLGLTARIAGLGLALAPLVLLWRDGHGVRLAVPALALALLVGWNPEPRGGEDVDVLYRSEGLLGQLMVVDLADEFAGAGNTHRVLFVNRTAQTWIDRDTGAPVWDYVRFINTVASIKPSGSRALVLGLGGGTIAAGLQDLGYIVDNVELDARIAEIARRYFGLELNGELFVDDGRHYLEATDSRYDLILFDVYQAEVPPVHLLTREAFERATKRLAPGGMIIVNYSGYWTGSAGRGARSIYRTLMAAGLNVDLMPTGSDEHTRNNLFIASPDPVNFDQTRRALIVGGRQRSIPSQFQPVPAEALDDALVLVDDRPILDHLNLEPAARWRETYYTYFTQPFREKGVPLFQ